MSRLLVVSLIAAFAATPSCRAAADRANDRELIVFNAGSLAIPLRAALDSFAALQGGIAISQESAGSLETARKLTELHKSVDVIAVADEEVIPKLLMPTYANWYLRIARNRMVLAYTQRSQFANTVNAETWWDVVRRRGVQVGRADPNRDPNGYRTLLLFQLAEHHYRRPNLAAELLASAPLRNVRPKESDLIALLQAGEFDYIWSYESIAQAAGLLYVQLPNEINLGDPLQASTYATASVRVLGNTLAESITVHGQPIMYGLTIPKNAPHPPLAELFVAYLASDAGRRVLRSARLDVLKRFESVGTDVPASLR